MSHPDHILVVRFLGSKIKIYLNGSAAGYTHVYIKTGKYSYA